MPDIKLLSLDSKPALPSFVLLRLDSASRLCALPAGSVLGFTSRGCYREAAKPEAEEAAGHALLLWASPRQCCFNPAAAVPFCCNTFQFVAVTLLG